MVSRFSWRKASFQAAFIWLRRIHVLMRLFAYVLALRTLSPTFLRVCRWASTGAKRRLRERLCMSGLGNSMGTDPSALPILSHFLKRTCIQKRCHLSNICICAMQMTAISSVYISVSSNDNYWLQSHLAWLHQWAGLQWVSLQMCHRQFTAVVQSGFLYLTCPIMCCSSGWLISRLIKTNESWAACLEHMGQLKSWKFGVWWNSTAVVEHFWMKSCRSCGRRNVLTGKIKTDQDVKPV